MCQQCWNNFCEENKWNNKLSACLNKEIDKWNFSNKIRQGITSAHLSSFGFFSLKQFRHVANTLVDKPENDEKFDFWLDVNKVIATNLDSQYECEKFHAYVTDQIKLGNVISMETSRFSLNKSFITKLNPSKERPESYKKFAARIQEYVLTMHLIIVNSKITRAKILHQKSAQIGISPHNTSGAQKRKNCE